MSEPDSGTYVVEARGLTREYAGRPVLRGVELQVAGGEVVALLGPNGAGKTTLLRVFALLLRPNAGVLRVMGLDPRREPVRARRHVGYVGHESGCYEDLTAAENLSFHADLHGVGDPVRRVTELLVWAGLKDAAHRPVRTYSRGMQQRLALARALLHAPDLLLLDEPFTGLDRAGRDLLAHLLAALAGDGHTVVLSLHDPTPVAAVVTRAAILHRGRLTWVDGGSGGDPQAVAAAYDRVVGEA